MIVKFNHIGQIIILSVVNNQFYVFVSNFEFLYIGNNFLVVIRIKELHVRSSFVFCCSGFLVCFQESVEPFHNEKAANHNCYYRKNKYDISHGSHLLWYPLNIKAFAQCLIISEHQKRFVARENLVGSNNRIDFSVFLCGDDVYIVFFANINLRN